MIFIFSIVAGLFALLWITAGVYTAYYQQVGKRHSLYENVVFCLFFMGIGCIGLVLFTPVGQWINKQYMKRHHDSIR